MDLASHMPLTYVDSEGHVTSKINYQIQFTKAMQSWTMWIKEYILHPVEQSWGKAATKNSM